LNDILGFRRTSEHTVSDAEQTRTHWGKRQETVVVFTGRYVAKGRRSLQ
jgi:hypothetical protein